MKKIKRKIALLLAFVMVFAILPVNVEAALMDGRGVSVLPTDAQNRALVGVQPTPGPTVGDQFGWFVGFNHPQLRNVTLNAGSYALGGGVPMISVANVSLSGGANWLMANNPVGDPFINPGNDTPNSGNVAGIAVNQQNRIGAAVGRTGAGDQLTNFPPQGVRHLIGNLVLEDNYYLPTILPIAGNRVSISTPAALERVSVGTPVGTSVGNYWRVEGFPGIVFDENPLQGNSITVSANARVAIFHPTLPGGMFELTSSDEGIGDVLGRFNGIPIGQLVQIAASAEANQQNLQREIGNAFTPGAVPAWVTDSLNVPSNVSGTILWHNVNITAAGQGMAAWLITPGAGAATIRGARHGGGNAILVVVSSPNHGLLPQQGVTWPIAFARDASNSEAAGWGSGNVVLSFVWTHEMGPTVNTPPMTLYTSQQAGADFNFPNPGTANQNFATFIDIGALSIQEQIVGSFDSPWWRIELNLDRGFSFASDTNTPTPGANARTHASDPTNFIQLNSWRPNGAMGFGVNAVPPGTLGNTQGVGLGLQNVSIAPNQNTNIQAPGGANPNTLMRNNVAGWDMTDIARDANRRITMDVTIQRPIVQDASGLVRVDTVNRITDGINIGNLRIMADDTARPGPVNVEIVMTRWTQAPGVGATRTLTLGTGQTNVFRNTFQVGFFESVDIIFELDEDQDLADFNRTTGMREWDWTSGRGFGTDFTGNWDAVAGESVDPYFHQTARVVLTETVPGVLPFTGLTEVLFTFGEGVQVLGVELETNNARFFRPVSGGVGAIEPHEAWFINGNTNMREGDLNVLVRPDYVSIRPHIEAHTAGTPQAVTQAQIFATFYISIQAGHEHLFGQDIVASVAFRGGGVNLSDDFAASEVVAIAVDPITVSVQETVIQDDGATAWGQIRTESIGNITITETVPGALYRNRQLWVGVEGGVSLGWGQADLISARATGVTTDGTSGLSVGPIVVDQRGFWVSITGESVTDPGSITFTGVEITGALVAGNDWGIIVAGDSVADNFGVSAFTWDGPIFGGGTFTRIGHGLFTPEPYLTAAFSFDGTDLFAPAPGVTAPGPGPAPGPGAGGAGGAIPVVLSQNLPYFIQHGPQQGQAIAPSFEMRAFGAGQNASAFVSVGAIADILGWTAAWDQGTQTATLTTNDGRTIVFVNGQATATVNGQTMQITNADGTPSPTYINNDRLMLSLLFFQQNLGVSIIWMGGTPGAFQIMIVP